MEVLFYHLERTRLENVLPQLLEKTLERGWRAIVRSGSGERLDALDSHLWTYRDDSFLGHGRSGQEQAGRQPILLTTSHENENQSDVLFLVDQSDMDQFESYQRAVVIFDGGDDEALNRAREDWKSVQKTDHDTTYWRQSAAGRWEKQA